MFLIPPPILSDQIRKIARRLPNVLSLREICELTQCDHKL